MTDFDDRMAALRARMVGRMAEDAAAIEALARDPAGRAELIDRVHKLAGIAGSLGFPEVSREAKACEQALAGPGEAARIVAPLTAALHAAVEARSG